MIIYGWGSFKLDECRPLALGLSQDIDAEYTIERRQKYFHLFWIPFFSLGKFWGLRKKTDGNLYDASLELQIFLDKLPLKHKTPWYTYALPILLVAIALIFYVSQKVESYQGQKQYEAATKKREQEMTALVQEPLLGTYFKIGYNGKPAYLKVLANDAQSLTCVYSEKDDYSDYVETSRYLFAFVKDSLRTSFDTVKIFKKDATKALNISKSFDFEGTELITGMGKMKIDEVKVIDYPVFKNMGGSYQEGRFMFLMRNIGETVSFKGITSNAETDMKFSEEVLPKEIKSGSEFILMGSYTGVEPTFDGSFNVVLPVASKAMPLKMKINGTHIIINQ